MARKKKKAETPAEKEEREFLELSWAHGERSNFVPGRELVSACRAIWARRLMAMGNPCTSTQQEPWRNYGECSGNGLCGYDPDGVGSWGKHVRQWEDRDDPID